MQWLLLLLSIGLKWRPPGRRLWPLVACLGVTSCQPAQAQDTLRYDNWRLVLNEEFNQPSDSSQLAGRWAFAYPWGRNLGGGEVQYYTGQEVNVRQGELQLTARRLPQPRLYGSDKRSLRYTSGMLFSHATGPDSLRPANTPPGDGYTYGLFELRGRQPRDAVSWPAFWLYGYPDEVDIFEGDARGFSTNVHLLTHEYWRPGPVEQSGCQCFYYWPGAGRLSSAYHRYALEWLPDRLVYYFDGVPIREETRFRPLGASMNVIANLAIVAWSNAPADTLAIDYIRVYRPRRLPVALVGPPTLRPAADGSRYTPPYLNAPELTNPTGPQTWELRESQPGNLALTLRRNLNPPCDGMLPLPVGGDWRAPWILGRLGTPLAVRLPGAVSWALLDQQGQTVRQGEAGPGLWQPPLHELPLGAYQLRLQTAEAVGYQSVYALEPLAPPQPTAEWLQPVPATAELEAGQ